MPKVKVQALNDLKIKSLKPKEKPYKVWDGKGLYILVNPSGSKLWRFNYLFNGKHKTLALGSYPEISLAEAREKALHFRNLIQNGIDPALKLAEEKQKQKNTFAEVAHEFLEKFSKNWAPRYISTVKWRLEKYLIPTLGDLPVSEITTHQIIQTLSPLIKAGKYGTVKKLRTLIGQVIRYAIITGRATYDPTSALKGLFPSPKPKHMPAVTEPHEFAGILRAFWDYPHNIVVRNALRTLVYTFQRPGEVASMKWEDIDFERQEWRFTLSKTYQDHIVPLSKQMIELLQEQKILAGNSPFVFPSFTSPKTRGISVETLNAALRRMGINTKEEQTSHGFRAVARTLIHEVLGYEPDIIEHQLGHKVPDRLGNAYNRTKFLKKRRQMMQDWADYVDSLVKS
jgi:integrase